MRKISPFRMLLFVALVVIPVALLDAQVTAETSGKGKTTYIGSLNLNRYAGYDGTGGYVWIGRGVSDAVDIFTIDGWSTVEGAGTQFWVGAGVNYHFAKIGPVDAAIYQYVTTPVNKRKEASTALYDAALLVSTHVGKIVPYVGYNAVIPLGDKGTAMFTPPKVEYNVPVGVALPVGKGFLYVEADFGDLTVYGVGYGITR